MAFAGTLFNTAAGVIAGIGQRNLCPGSHRFLSLLNQRTEFWLFGLIVYDLGRSGQHAGPLSTRTSPERPSPGL